jgi:hypothetical protein
MMRGKLKNAFKIVFSFLFQTEWVFCFNFYVICQKIGFFRFFSKFHLGPEALIWTFSGVLDFSCYIFSRGRCLRLKRVGSC